MIRKLRAWKNFSWRQEVVPENIVHLDPLTPSGDIEGWAYLSSEVSLRGSYLWLGTESQPHRMKSRIDIVRPDVGELKNSDGINGFRIIRPSQENLGLLLNGKLTASVDNRDAKVIFTDRKLLATQVLSRLGEKLDLDILIDEFLNAKSTALYWHFLVTSEMKKGGDLERVRLVANSTNAQRISSHRTRFEEIKLMLQYDSYDDALRIYDLGLGQATARKEIEAFKRFKSTYLINNQKDDLLSLQASWDQEIDETVETRTPLTVPSSRQEALIQTLDLDYFNQVHGSQATEIGEAVDMYLHAEHIGKRLSPNSSFDPDQYCQRYGCSREDSLLDLLSDQSLSKQPFEGFDPLFVYEYYCQPINFNQHPYLYYLENPTILLNPQQYFKSGVNKGNDSEPEYWNLSRANSHFANIYSPLTPKISNRLPKCIHVLVPAFDPKTISAGFFGVFSVAKLLSEIQSEYKVKLLFTDNFEFFPSLFYYTLSKTTGLEKLLDTVSYHFLRDGNTPNCALNPGDKFVATVWYTAKLASRLAEILGSKAEFLYLIQDYEAGFYPRNSHYAVAESTYNANYWALVSSQTLYQQLLKDKLVDPHKSVFFNNACAARQVTKEEFLQAHANKGNKRLLFYSRPEVDRNMFELTILALMLAYKEGIIDNGWDVFSIGLGSDLVIELNNFVDSHAFVNTVPRMTLHEYEDFILSTDVCLTLMASPHPSLLPFDFSGIGSLVVTNSFQTKGQEYFDGISDLIICCDPDPNDLVKGLKKAVEKSNDLDWRFNSLNINYPRDWQKTWNHDVRSLLKQWVNH
jgi:hypothetical protein